MTDVMNLTLAQQWGSSAQHRKLEPCDEIYTKPAILKVARKLMGCIDLDVASSATANRMVQAARYFTEFEDGLQQRWEGNVWCNPPFSQKAEWIARLLDYEGLWCSIFYCDLSTKSIRTLIERSPASYLVGTKQPFYRSDGTNPSLGMVMPVFSTNVAERCGVPESWATLSLTYPPSSQAKLLSIGRSI